MSIPTIKVYPVYKCLSLSIIVYKIYPVYPV